MWFSTIFNHFLLKLKSKCVTLPGWFQPTTGAICHLILVMVSAEVIWGLGIFCEAAMLGEPRYIVEDPSVLQVNPSVTDQKDTKFLQLDLSSRLNLRDLFMWFIF